MKRLTFSLLCLALLAVTGARAQDDSNQLALHLKSGDVLTGTVTKVDEEGVKLDIGDGIELFIRWDYTRGDKHYELRKDAADFTKFKSVMKLADFCHLFAMDEEEAWVLVAALKLQPGNQDVRDRLKELPKVEGLEVPGQGDQAKPEPGPEIGKEPDPPLPPTRKAFTVYVKMVNTDDAAKTWMEEHLEEMTYRIGTEKEHEIRAELEINLTLTKNPQFMGAELYAIYDGKLTWKLYRKDEHSAFAQNTVKSENVRRDSRDEARSSCRTDLCESAFKEMFNEMEKLR